MLAGGNCEAAPKSGDGSETRLHEVAGVGGWRFVVRLAPGDPPVRGWSGESGAVCEGGLI